MYDVLFDEAPLAERADFFIRIKKAGWSDESVHKYAAMTMSDAPGGPKTPEWEMLETRTLEQFGPMEGQRRNLLRRQIWESRAPIRESMTATLKEKGRQRAVSSIASERERKKARRGARVGKAVGTIGGMAGGAALGKKYVGGPAGAIGGAALGALAGHQTGKAVGEEVDIAKNATVRFALALQKMAQGAGAEMSPPSGPSPTLPANYLMAEQMAQKAQQDNEASFYRQQLQSVSQELQGMQQEAAMAQQQLMMLQQQQANTNMQIQQATEQAVAAQDQATQNAVQAANMRIGFQKLREQVLQVASQEPEALASPSPEQMAQQGMAPQPGGAEMSSEPEPQMGPAGEAPAPGGGAPTVGGGVGEGENLEAEPASYEQQAETAEPQSQFKMGSILESKLPWAMMGALAGGAHNANKVSQGTGSLKKRVQDLEGQEGSFRQALQLAKAKAQLAHTEVTQKYPIQTTAASALGGAALGAEAGPRMVKELKRLGGNISKIKAM